MEWTAVAFACLGSITCYSDNSPLGLWWWELTPCPDPGVGPGLKLCKTSLPQKLKLELLQVFDLNLSGLKKGSIYFWLHILEDFAVPRPGFLKVSLSIYELLPNLSIVFFRFFFCS